MSSASYRVRRATVDDLPSLSALWRDWNLPVPELEKRLKEIQVIELPDGSISGALGMEIQGRHGRLHSEAFADSGLADQFRELLWERMQSVAANHGLVAVWTQETPPFWRLNGFTAATDEAMKKLPQPWAAASGSWLTLKLRDEEVLKKALDLDVTLLLAEERAATQKALRSAKFLKTFGTLLAVLLAVVVVVVSLRLLANNRLLVPHH